jgi:hypothetical protein
VDFNLEVKRLEFLTFPPYIKSHESNPYFQRADHYPGPYPQSAPPQAW